MTDAKQLEQEAKECLTQARELLHKAEALADAGGFTLGWNLAYGMGGYYYPKGFKLDYREDSEGEYEESGQWQSSSSQC